MTDRKEIKELAAELEEELDGQIQYELDAQGYVISVKVEGVAGFPTRVMDPLSFAETARPFVIKRRKFAVLCDDCKIEVTRTNKIVESYQGTICQACR